MSQFDWQTDTEHDWDESTHRSWRPEPTPSPVRRSWWLILIAGLALTLAGWLVYRQVQQQVEAANEVVAADILSTHNLVQTAVARQDLELFRSLLSGRDPLWTEDVEALLTQDLLLNRAAWRLPAVDLGERPLTLADLEAASGSATLTITPDLTAAELQYAQPYTILAAPGVTETVTLWQTAVYRRGSQRWLLSPPDEDFWGEWTSHRGQLLTLTYAARDETVAQRLAADLEALLLRLCQMDEELICPEDLRLAVRLATRPEDLRQAAQRQELVDGGLTLRLPSPTLWGWPRDEAAYAALYRAYGTQVATAVVAHLLPWECCYHAPFFQVLVESMLHDLDLTVWPVVNAHHQRVLRESVSMDDLTPFWNETRWRTLSADEGWELYAAVDFLLQTYTQVDPLVWLQALEPRRSLFAWVGQALTDSSTMTRSGPAVLEMLDEAWWQFAYTQALLTQQQTPPPTPFPAQQLQLMCISDEANPLFTLLEHDLDAANWSTVLTRAGYMLSFPFPNDDGWVLQNLDFDGEETRNTEIWRAGALQTLLGETPVLLTLGQFDPTGRYLLGYTGPGLDMEAPTPLLFDLEACEESACSSAMLLGQPFWSPDGRHTIIAEFNLFQSSYFLINGRMMLFDLGQSPLAAPLYLGDGQGQLPDAPVPLAEGYSPFWVNDTTFGYVRPALESGEEVMLQAVAPAEPRRLLTTADLRALSTDGVSQPAAIRYVLTHPQQPSLMFVVASDALGREAFVFAYDWQSGELALRLRSQIRPYHALGVSPDGRWLVLAGSDGGAPPVGRTNDTLYIHNIATEQTQTYITRFGGFVLSPVFDWSADGRWLLFFVDDRVISLVAPDYDYQWVFAHEQGNCVGLNWINRYE